MRRVAFTALLLGLSASPAPAAGPDADGGDLFTTQVRPLLAKHCFKCHGPDDKARKAKMRLDFRKFALQPARSGNRPVVPGKPEKSELIRRIFGLGGARVMPPPSAKNPLTDQQKQLLKRWVAEGAQYRTHWAFVPPRQAPLPKVELASWPRNPIDTFVLARLEKEGLRPSPPADRYTLVRRVYLDLVGLPPTPEEAEAFVKDDSPGAYEKLVDRLLASPAYGERWARRWLDLARYADTNGYEKDRPRSIWPYRDWVIRALNADMPFDQFTVEQIAGDMLPGATLQQKVATGFHRNTMLNEEGGIDPLEFRFHAMTDRVATTGTVWLGLTTGCAQCHTHKFDPISHAEYYRLTAFLNNADEPEVEVPTPEVTKRRKEIEAKIASLEADLPNQFPVDEKNKKDARPVEVRRKEHLERKFAEWVKHEAEHTVRWTVLRPVEAKANLPLLTVLGDSSVLASGDQSKSDTYTLKFRTDLRGITAIRLEVLPDERLPRHGPGRVYYEGPFGDFFLSEFTLLSGGKKVKLAKASQSFASGKLKAAAAIDGDAQTGWSINGGQGRPHCAVFNLAEPLADGRDLQVKMLFERYYSAGLGRFRISVTADPKPAVARDLPADVEELLVVPAEKRTPAQKEKLLRHYLRVAPELAKARAEIEGLRKQMPAYPTTLVMKERPADDPRPTHLHNRGEFLQPRQKVEPGVLAVLHPFPKDLPRNRLGFAKWLVSPEDPLVGRVTVNRQWAAFFGKGIVPTLGDFGYQGDAPSHPELLDWLAVEFVQRGWSVKQVHRLIVTSATYRQSSKVTPGLLAKDPDNRLLARGPRVRLEAEQLRDCVLRYGGLLAERLGGPSVFPPQPPGVTTEGAYGALEWKVSAGLDRYRRGLYTFSKRTAPFAMSSTFDAPSGEVCLARREVSNTPLQALTLLNDVAMTESAQALGRMMAGRKGTVGGRAEYLFRRVLTRAPSEDELALLVKFYEAQKKRFEAKELDAEAVAGHGAGDVNERAAWSALARVLFNLDEAIVKG
jgi:mono/diheme cytochrome c family protein